MSERLHVGAALTTKILNVGAALVANVFKPYEKLKTTL